MSVRNFPQHARVHDNCMRGPPRHFFPECIYLLLTSFSVLQQLLATIIPFLLSHSIGHLTAQDLLRFKGWGNRLHPLMEDAVKSDGKG